MITREAMIEAGAKAVDQLAVDFAQGRTDEMPDGRGCARAVLDAIWPLLVEALGYNVISADQDQIGQESS